MKPWTYIVWIALLGCQTNEKKPTEILTPNRFAQVCVELCVVQAAQQQKALPSNYQMQPEKWNEEVLARLQTDTATFNRSYRFYFTHPEEMNAVLSEAETYWQNR